MSRFRGKVPRKRLLSKGGAVLLGPSETEAQMRKMWTALAGAALVIGVAAPAWSVAKHQSADQATGVHAMADHDSGGGSHGGGGGHGSSGHSSADHGGGHMADHGGHMADHGGSRSADRDD